MNTRIGSEICIIEPGEASIDETCGLLAEMQGLAVLRRTASDIGADPNSWMAEAANTLQCLSGKRCFALTSATLGQLTRGPWDIFRVKTSSYLSRFGLSNVEQGRLLDNLGLEEMRQPIASRSEVRLILCLHAAFLHHEVVFFQLHPYNLQLTKALLETASRLGSANGLVVLLDNNLPGYVDGLLGEIRIRQQVSDSFCWIVGQGVCLSEQPGKIRRLLWPAENAEQVIRCLGRRLARRYPHKNIYALDLDHRAIARMVRKNTDLEGRCDYLAKVFGLNPMTLHRICAERGLGTGVTAGDTLVIRILIAHAIAESNELLILKVDSLAQADLIRLLGSLKEYTATHQMILVDWTWSQLAEIAEMDFVDSQEVPITMGDCHETA